MSAIIGIYRGRLFTANPNRNEISIRDVDRLSLMDTVSFPTGGLSSKGIIMKDNLIFGSDRRGIYFLDADELCRREC